MVGSSNPRPGEVFWQDLTVKDACGIKEFYSEVVGWESADHPMDGYADYDMKHAESGEIVAGICHAKGQNIDVPPQWMLYVAVSDLAASTEACERRGGEVLNEQQPSGGSASAIVRNPAGAVITLYEIQSDG